MVVFQTDLNLTDIADEQNNRFDQKIYLAERKFAEFLSRFDEVEPLGRYVDSIRNGQDFKTNYYSDVETEIIYISVNQISSGVLGKLHWDDITYLDVEDEQIEVEAQEDDILITRSGSYPGIAWRVSKEYLREYRIVPSGFVQRLRLRSNADIEPEFVAAYLNCPPVKMLTQSYACGKEQLNISQDYIESIPVPVIPESKRKSIIDMVDTYQSRIEEIQKLIDQMKYRQGVSVVDLISGDDRVDMTIPEVPEVATDSDIVISNEWGLPTRRGQRESTFYVSNS